MPMVLIIDDDVAVRTSLDLLFRRAGYQSQCASEPEKAFKIVKEQTIDLIIMDMNFSLETSGEEGLQLLKNIKNISPVFLHFSSEQNLQCPN